MLKYAISLLALFAINLAADISLSSPQLKLNPSGERVVEFKIQGQTLNDKDIVLKEYKSDEPLNEDNISYTLLEDFSTYNLFSIILDNKYEGNYFSFKLSIKNEIAKDIFIFLPSKIETTNLKPIPRRVYKPKKLDQRTNVVKQIQQEAPSVENKKENIIEAGEITTMWSIASKIKKQTNDTSIYQIMWSIYLGNKDTFIDGNINLVRKDKNLVVPSYLSMQNTPDDEARSSIIAMNKTFSIDLTPAFKSLLILSAPKIKKDINPVETKDEPKKDAQDAVNLNDEEFVDPKDLIEMNTKQLDVLVESRVVNELVKEVESIKKPNDTNDFGLKDLLFVAVISIISGILIALIYIQLNSRKTKKIQYDFDEASDSQSSTDGLPKGLSIKNNHDEQQLDLAVTYFEMSDFKNCENILKELIKNTDDLEIKTSSQNLLTKLETK